MKTDQKTDKVIYYTGLCILSAVIIYLLITYLFDIHISRYLMPCVFHTVTGYYCPGCGGTRAVAALLHGEFIQSFRFHPMVVYAAAVSGWFMLSQTIERIFGGRFKIGMHYRDCYLWIALAIVVINFLVKNAALIFFNTDLLAV